MSANPYDPSFYALQADLSRRSADRVVGVVIDALAPRSVVDVGCGVGTWLAAFVAAGITDVTGLDGDYVDRSQLQITADRFRPTDLSRPFTVDRRFELAISLEVAEHLPPGRSASFVEDLTRAAPAVLFSAAVPGQDGSDHVNERWQDEWVALFDACGYRAVDLVRPAVWYDEEIAPWYSQNTLLYVDGSIDLVAPRPMPWRVVHPRSFTQKVDLLDQPRPLREALGQVPAAVARRLRR